MNVNIMLTNNCNIKCPFCYQEKKTTKNFMTIENFKKILNNHDLKKDVFCLYGGEPTLNNQVFEAALKSEIKNLKLITNSSKLLSKNDISKFKHIQFSYNIGLFEENILIMTERCLESNIDFTINIVLDNCNIEKIKKFVFLNEDFFEHFNFALNFKQEVSDEVIQNYYYFKIKQLEKKENKNLIKVLEDKFYNHLNFKLQKTKGFCDENREASQIEYDELGNSRFCESCSLCKETKKEISECDYCPVNCSINLCENSPNKRTSEVRCKIAKIDYQIYLSSYLKYLKGEIK